jgi:hypothetical protein
MLKKLLLASLVVGMGSAQAQEIVGQRYQINRTVSPEGPWQWVVRQVNTPEGQALLAAAGAAFAIPPGTISTVVAVADVAARFEPRRGEEYRGILPAPGGYSICRVQRVGTGFSVSRRTTFNTTINRSSDNNGLSWYAHIPRERWRHGRSWVNVDMYVWFVRRGLESQYNCSPSGLHPWLCSGGRRGCRYDTM